MVSSFLEHLWNRANAVWQMDLQLAPATTVLVGPNRSLVHSRYKSRPVCRANGGRYKGFGKPKSRLGQGIQIRRLDRLLPVAGKVGRHVVDNDPNYIRAIGRYSYASDQPAQQRQDS